MATTHDRILLGTMRPDIDAGGAGEKVYLTKHKWDCGWYWAFGYLGNKNCHFHFESLLYNVKCGGEVVQWPMPDDLFSHTELSTEAWWVIRDLFTQAYALKEAAAVYRHGGHNASRAGVTDVIKSADKEAVLNADLKVVLDMLWTVLTSQTLFASLTVSN